ARCPPGRDDCCLGNAAAAMLADRIAGGAASAPCRMRHAGARGAGAPRQPTVVAHRIGALPDGHRSLRVRVRRRCPGHLRHGARVYLPDGGFSTDGTWLVLDARTGAVIGSIRGGDGPHNTVVGLSGRWVYLGPRNSPYLAVASTASDRVIRRIGPLFSGVRPF